RMRVRPVGADALLLEVDDPAGWFTELWHRRDAGELTAAEIVPGARTVLLDGVADPAATSAALRTWTVEPADPTDHHGSTDAMVEVPVAFDGEDLADVAELWRTDEVGVAQRLLSTELRVAFCGFAPGWAYLSGLPAELAVPRLDSPRPRVPAGS